MWTETKISHTECELISDASKTFLSKNTLKKKSIAQDKQYKRMGQKGKYLRNRG